MPVLHAISSSLFVKHTYQLHTVSPARWSRLIVVYTKEGRQTVQTLKLQSRRYVFMGFNRTHLIMLTISIITAGQLNVNRWLSML